MRFNGHGVTAAPVTKQRVPLLPWEGGLAYCSRLQGFTRRRLFDILRYEFEFVFCCVHTWGIEILLRG